MYILLEIFQDFVNSFDFTRIDNIFERNPFSVSLVTIFVTLAIIWVIYWFYFHVHCPKVSFQPNSFNNKIYRQCPTLFRRYYPPLWLFSSHLQGPLGLVVRKNIKIPYQQESFLGKDGAQLYLYWHHSELPDDAPIVVVLPGIMGGTDKPYITHFIEEAATCGWKSVVIVFPGCIIEQEVLNLCKSPRFYSPLDISDIEIAVDLIKNRFPKAPLIGLGHSFGASMLVKYLGTVGENTPLRSCISISNPWNFTLVSKRLQSSSLIYKKIYDPHFASHWLRLYKENVEVLKQNKLINHDYMEEKLKSKNITCKEFDEHVAARMYGFTDVEKWYHAMSCTDSLKNIKIPLCVIHAWDDPIIPKNAVPTKELEELPNVFTIFTEKGGHTGWLQGLLPIGLCFVDEICVEYIEAILNEKT